MQPTDSDAAPRLPQIQMRRKTLTGLPNLHDLPTGISLRKATHSDAFEIAKVMTSAFGDSSWTKERVISELLDDPHCQTTWVILVSGQIAATATTLMYPSDPQTGIVHWVGADPQQRGKKLGFWVCLAVLHDVLERGCEQSILLTDDDRLPAIKTYLNLGFEPDLTHESHAERWALIRQKLGC